MSGPALKKKKSHMMIHMAVEGEIEEALAVLDGYNRNAESINGIAVKTLIDLWHDKVIAHADEEEASLYVEIKMAVPGMDATLLKLSRDHDLLRKLLVNLSTEYSTHRDYAEMSMINHTMLNILKIHSSDEMAMLSDCEENLST